MAPDLAYFLPWEVRRESSHSAMGLLAFCLPASLACYGLFHGLVRPMACSLLPAPVRRRLPGRLFRPGFPEAPWGAVVCSALVGSATHLAWDAFTHASGAIAAWAPPLGATLFSWGGYRISPFRLLQHGSTAVGLGCIAWWTLRWLRTAPLLRGAPDPEPLPRLRPVLLSVLLLAPLAYGILEGSPSLASGPPLVVLRRFASRLIFAGGTAFLLLLPLTALVWVGLWASRRRAG